ncbi:Predicted dehydrogenase [Pontibacter akesuensis]|uniref:Predicted dehydrogenase n=2 Tax=Pontibacter akesuensis TaxID=388950 RepID=A0A1I7H5J4_9BACT|nr:Predicted dehydrogenase [Pontibacter akesuensis]
MAVAYAEVLQDMKVTFSVVGRGQSSAEKFEQATGVSPVTGGIEMYIAEGNVAPNTQAIIATGTESLMKTLLLLLNAGVRKILVEKPAAISIEELIAHEEEIKSYASEIYIAYNRRYYTSVLEAEKLIEEDGGLMSMQFEFTEWAHRIEPLEKAAGVKENWFFANSTHVVDLAFFLAGKPEQWQAYAQAGNISWHSPSNFVGAGITEKGVLFSYAANWESAGRWSLELLTRKRRIYLKPLEGLNIQALGSISVEAYEFDDTIDKKYKPGVYKQVTAFVKNDTSRLVSYQEHVHNSKSIYSTMLK